MEGESRIAEESSQRNRDEKRWLSPLRTPVPPLWPAAPAQRVSNPRPTRLPPPTPGARLRIQSAIGDDSSTRGSPNPLPEKERLFSDLLLPEQFCKV